MTGRSPTAPPPSTSAVMIVLSYLWILAIVPLLVERENSNLQWHAKHGFVLMLAELILWMAFSIVVSVLGFVAGFLGALVSLFAPFLWMAILVVHVVAIFRGLNGRRLLIPGVSNYVSRL
jgi:uncharacterized membrane protein